MPTIRTLIRRNVVLPLAGSNWTLEEVVYNVGSDGVEFIPAAEMRRLRDIVAKKLLDRVERTPEEQEFLDDWQYDQA